MKMYYLLLDPSCNPPIRTYWCGDNKKSDFLTNLRGFVIPLGTKKPDDKTICKYHPITKKLFEF